MSEYNDLHITINVTVMYTIDGYKYKTDGRLTYETKRNFLIDNSEPFYPINYRLCVSL